MSKVLCKKRTAFLISFLLLLSSRSLAVDLPDVGRPQMSSQWPTIYFSPSSVEGAYGPQIQLSTVDVKGVPSNIYLEKLLHERAKSEDGIQVGKIVVDQNALSSNVELSQLVASYEHRHCKVSELQELANKLHSAVREHGICCTVYISLNPDNSVEFKMVPLRVRNVEIKDGKYFKARAIKHHIDFEPGDHLNTTVLERNVRQIQNNPDITLETTIKPVEASPDEVDIEVAVVDDKRPLHVVPFFTNLGAYPFGESMPGWASVHNNILGFGDNLMTSTVFSRHSSGSVTHYEIPLGSHGTKVMFEHSFLRAKPEEDDLETFDVKGSASVYTLGLSRILYDRESTRVMTYGMFDIKQANADHGNRDFEREQFRDFRLGLQFDRDDSGGNTSLLNEFALGLDILGASHDGSPLVSQPGAGGNFFRYTGSVTRLQNLPLSSVGILRGIVQLTPNQLPPTDYFGIGGAFGGRGYREGYYIGDSGFLLSGEWQVPFYLLPKSWKIPFTDESARDNVQFVTFLEYAASFLNDQPADADANEQILGTGVGFRIKLTKYFNLRIDLGFPLLRQPPFNQAPRLHFGLESEMI